MLTEKQLDRYADVLIWDLVNTEKKQVTAHLRGGKTKIIYENGKFTI
ncbi:MAG: hypothetical protein ABFS43_01230 [Thermodesulfobacteriota bacterium]